MAGTMGITRAEARRAVRANAERSARMAALAEQLEDALRAVLPYVESRIEDMDAERDDVPAHIWEVCKSEEALAKARAAFQAAQDAISAAEGRR